MSTINLVAHGLTAGQRVVISNITPSSGTGVDPDFVYFVLAAGLTANAFQISETDAGTPITILLPITAASLTVVPETTDTDAYPAGTYTAVSDPADVMAPPVAVTTPGPPTCFESLVSGIVRLYVQVYDTPQAQLRAWEVQTTHTYDTSGNPNWGLAQTVTLPVTAGVSPASMSIPAVSGATYTSRVRAEDVYGNYSAFGTPSVSIPIAGNDALSAALAALANDVSDGIITETKIAPNSISTPKLQAGAVTAQILAATIVLASLIKTANSGRRIEIDVDGIRLYDTDESLLVRIPTNGDAVFVKGQVSADSLVSQTSAVLRGTVSHEAASVTTLQGGVAAPSVSPTLVASVDSLTLLATPTGSPLGLAYDSSTLSYLIATDPSSGYIWWEFSSADGSFIRKIAATGNTSTVTATLGATSHVSDSAQGLDGSTNSHVNTPLTIPSGLTNVKITKVSAYFNGHNGTCQARVGVWANSSGTPNALAESATFTAASGGATGTGNSAHYDKSLSSPLSVTSGSTYRFGWRHTDTTEGHQFDRDDGSGKTTFSGDGSSADGTGWGTLNSSSKPNVYATYTYDVDTRLETAPNIGIAVDSTNVYILDNTGVIWKYLRSDGSYVTHSAVQTAITGTKSKAGLFYDATANELIITTTTGTGAGVFPKFVRVTPSTLAVSSTVYSAAAGTTFSGTTDTFRGGARLADPLNASAATYWIATTSAVYAYTFSGTVATQTSNREFGQAITSGDGLTYDGTQFRGYDNASPNKVWKFSGYDYTTAQPTTLWVGYSWYDGNATGGTHETTMGPRASISIRRRERVLVQTPVVPSGGTDDPDHCRVYTLQNATDTGVGTFWLQNSGEATNQTSRYLTAYTTASSHDITPSTFAAGTAAILKPAVAGWQLNGDGTATLGLTATGGKPPVVNVFTTGGSWSKPAGLSHIVVEVVGGGGAGGGQSSVSATTSTQAVSGAGGGAGGYCRKTWAAASLTGPYTYTVGGGGTGTTTTQGAGTASTFVGPTTLTANGGAAGGTTGPASVNAIAIGGIGGTATNGEVNVQGGSGAGANVIVAPSAGVRNPSGVGGGNPVGAGGTPPSNATGEAGHGFGGGGSGVCVNVSSGPFAGGNGAGGAVIVTEFYVG